jgi:hypothetical protein
VGIAQQELDRRRGVVDVMLSAHALLRDRYRRKAQIVDLTVFGGSIVLCATVFIDPQLAARTRIGETGTRLLLGITSVLIFFLAIVSMLFDWKEASGRHSRAASLLGDLKAKGRLLAADDQAGAVKPEDFVQLYDSVMQTLPPIPDDQFVRLKAYHRRKTELSRAIDDNPTAPVFVLRLKLRLEGIARALRPSQSRTARND